MYKRQVTSCPLNYNFSRDKRAEERVQPRFCCCFFPSGRSVYIVPVVVFALEGVYQLGGPILFCPVADNPNYAPCIENLEGAWDAFLFSVETQSTIGYGIIYAHPECGSTLPIIYLQVTAGFLFETLLFGFIFAKVRCVCVCVCVCCLLYTSDAADER